MTRYENQSARMAPATPPLDTDVRQAMDAVMRGRPPLLLFTTLARDRRLFEKFFAGGLLDRGHLALRQREIVIDRVTARCSAEYEWGVHVATFADRAGLDRAAMRSLTTGGPDDACWAPDERVLIAVCDAALDECDVPDEHWRELTRHFADEAILEILLLIGFYRTTSLLVRTLRLPLEAEAARFEDVRDRVGRVGLEPTAKGL